MIGYFYSIFASFLSLLFVLIPLRVPECPLEEPRTRPRPVIRSKMEGVKDSLDPSDAILRRSIPLDNSADHYLASKREARRSRGTGSRSDPFVPLRGNAPYNTFQFHALELVSESGEGEEEEEEMTTTPDHTTDEEDTHRLEEPTREGYVGGRKGKVGLNQLFRMRKSSRREFTEASGVHEMSSIGVENTKSEEGKDSSRRSNRRSIKSISPCHLRRHRSLSIPPSLAESSISSEHDHDHEDTTSSSTGSSPTASPVSSASSHHSFLRRIFKPASDHHHLE